jgi:hypothetical protein
VFSGSTASTLLADASKSEIYRVGRKHSLGQLERLGNDVSCLIKNRDCAFLAIAAAAPYGYFYSIDLPNNAVELRRAILGVSVPRCWPGMDKNRSRFFCGVYVPVAAAVHDVIRGCFVEHKCQPSRLLGDVLDIGISCAQYGNFHRMHYSTQREKFHRNPFRETARNRISETQ